VALSPESKRNAGDIAKALGCSCLIVAVVSGGFLVAVLVAVVLWLSHGIGDVDSDAEWSGWEAAWIGDVDGDGVPEVALMTWCEPVSVVRRDWGVLRVLSGASGATLATFRDLGTQGSVENRIGPAGDMDGDGRTEVWWMIGDRELHVGPLGSPRFVLDIEAGSRCTPLGDLDGDGCVDMRVTRHPLCEEGSIASSLVSGSSGEVLWSITESHGYPGPACRIDDSNGDGTEDIALVDSTLQVRVVSGRDGTLLYSLPRYVDPYGSLEALGDYDGDGTIDLLHCNNELKVLSAVDGRELAARPRGSSFEGAHSPGDVNGDGILDIACNGDTLHILDGSDISLLCEAEGSAGGGRGDWNGDGHADLLVAHNLTYRISKEAPPSLWRLGRIEVLSGKDGTTLKTFDEGVLPLGP
jgi:hypothetical protein